MGFDGCACESESQNESESLWTDGEGKTERQRQRRRKVVGKNTQQKKEKREKNCRPPREILVCLLSEKCALSVCVNWRVEALLRCLAPLLSFLFSYFPII